MTDCHVACHIWTKSELKSLVEEYELILAEDINDERLTVIESTLSDYIAQKGYINVSDIRAELDN